MGEIRILLAVCALLVGGVSLLLGFAAARRRRRAAAASGRTALYFVYGSLFFLTGILVWIRGPVVEEGGLLGEINANQPPQNTEGTRSTATEPKSAALPPEVKLKRLAAHPEQADQASPDAVTAISSSANPPMPVNSQPADSKSDPRVQAATQQSVLLEDRIYNAVASAFDRIERLFAQYAAPVPAAGIRPETSATETPLD